MNTLQVKWTEEESRKEFEHFVKTKLGHRGPHILRRRFWNGKLDGYLSFEVDTMWRMWTYLTTDIYLEDGEG